MLKFILQRVNEGKRFPLPKYATPQSSGIDLLAAIKSSQIIKPNEHKLNIFLVTKFKKIYHFLIQAKLEPGNLDKFEIAPTIQCKQSDFENKRNNKIIQFLDLVKKSKEEQFLFDSYQSEEGGRFYQESHRHLIIDIDKDQIKVMPKQFIWISLNQLLALNKYNNYLNIHARSLLSLIRYS